MAPTETAPDSRTAQSRTDFTRAAALTPEIVEQVHDAFDYHAWDDKKKAAGDAVRAALVHATLVVIANVPPSADRSAAIRKIREARMDANSAITHGGRY
jgi:hypothetical protein